jgi:hypothetical protein
VLSLCWALAGARLAEPRIHTEDWAEADRARTHEDILIEHLRQHMYAQRVDGALAPDATLPGGVNARMEWGLDGRAGWSSTGDEHFKHLLQYLLRESGCTRRRAMAAQYSQPAPPCLTGYTILYTTGAGYGEDASAMVSVRYKVDDRDEYTLNYCTWREGMCRVIFN